MNAYYDLRVFSPTGMLVMPSLTDFISLSASRSRNNPGAFEMALPPDYPEDTFVEDSIVEIWRSADGRTWNPIDDTCWFVRDVEYDLDEQGKEVLFVRGHDTTGLLNRRIVPWFAFSSAEAGASSPGYKTAPADTVIYELWMENFGAGVEGTLADGYNTPAPSVTAALGWDIASPVLTANLRTMRREPHSPFLSVAPLDIAPLAEQATAWSNAGDMMRQAAEASEALGTKIWFDIVYTPGDASRLGDFEFKIWVGNRGAYLADKVVFSPYWGTMATAKWRQNWSEMANWVHVAGAGQGDLRLVAGILDDESIERSPFYPIEAFIDGGELYEQSAMESLGKAELHRLRPKKTISGEIRQSPDLRFGRDYNYGSVVGAFYRNTTVVGPIESYSLEVASGEEKIDIPLEGEEV